MLLITSILNESGKIILAIFLTKLLSDKNLERFSHFVKLQILVLYLDWVLQKTPVRKPPEEQGR